MTTEVEKAIKRMEKAKDLTEKAHIKAEIDQMSLSSGEVEQAIEREANRKTNDIKEFREERKQ